MGHLSVTAEDPIRARISALRTLMKKTGVSACVIPTADPHMSEYISDHYKSREFITGFTGSAGTAVITDSDAVLWTDSRYWLQAEEELDGSGFRLFRDGAPGTLSVEDYLCRTFGSASHSPVVCADGRLLTSSRADRLRGSLRSHGLLLDTDRNLIDEIRADTPALECSAVFEHPLRFAGLSRAEKISGIRALVSCQGAQALIVPMLDDIAWLLNLRGRDIPCNPVFFAFAVLTAEDTEWPVRLYAFTDRFSPQLKDALARDGVRLLAYESFYDDLPGLGDLTVMLDRTACSDSVLQLLPSSARILDQPSPISRCKALKNEAEMDGIRAAHLRDGVAMCRFLYQLKSRVHGSTEPALTELSAGSMLDSLRADQDLFIENSFDPIVAYGPHGAIVHYSATEETDVRLEPQGLLLVDSGGQYSDGTTDITRTIVLGPLSEEEKVCFTAVLRGHINLARARFRRGCTGADLDVLAHLPLWEMGLDYGHGTGHGVGAFLNVHEDPIRVHWAAGRRSSPLSAKEKRARSLTPAAFISSELPILEKGMLFSDEPGFYSAGKFGVRHENLLLCLDAGETEYGDFLRFEPVTLVPFDREGILPGLMQPAELDWLNAYHEKVFRAIAPHLDEDERAWLKKATRPIG